MNKLLRNINYKLLFLLMYIIFGCLLLYFHEPWRDEANTWLIAKNLNLLGILNEVRADGNPCLYYFFLRIFVKLGLPYIFNNFISFGISIITAYLLIYKTKLNNFLKILFLFSSLFIYYGGVFGRSYCMVNLLFVLIVILYNNRFEHIILYSFFMFFLINTHVMMLGFCLGLFIVNIFDYFKKNGYRSKMLLGILIQLLGFLLLFFQLFGGITSNRDVSIVILPFINLIPFIFAILLLVIIILKIKSRYVFISILSLIFQLFSILFVPHFNRYILNLLYLNLLFLLMYYKFDIKIKYIIYGLVFYIFVISIPIYYNDLRYMFSDSKSVGEYIKDNVNVDDKILCIPDYLCVSVVPYLSNYQLFDVFDNSIKNMDYSVYKQDLLIDINNVLNNNLYDYVIIGDNYKELKDDKYSIVYYSKNKLIQYDENYVVFKRESMDG